MVRSWRDGDIRECRGQYAICLPGSMDGIIERGITYFVLKNEPHILHEYQKWRSVSGNETEKILSGIFSWYTNDKPDIVILPTRKYHNYRGNLSLLELSLYYLKAWADSDEVINFALPPIGTNSNELDWANHVWPLFEYLPDRFLVVTPRKEVIREYLNFA